MSDSATSLTGAQVLVIDDVPANLDVLRQALESAGCDALVASDGAQGVEIAADARPDLILLDVVMPGMDGFATCRRLKADPVTQEIPVIFVSARGEAEDVLEGFGAGGADYVVKPCHLDEVLARVRSHIEWARLTRSLADRNQQLEAEIAGRQAGLPARAAQPGPSPTRSVAMGEDRTGQGRGSGMELSGSCPGANV